MRTSLGIFLAQIRLSNGETLREMAKKIGVSSAFLSAVENGKKKMPEAWKEKLQVLYSLTTQQIAELEQAMLESNDKIELDVSDVSKTERELVISFARKFSSLDQETIEKIRKILSNPKEG